MHGRTRPPAWGTGPRLLRAIEQELLPRRCVFCGAAMRHTGRFLCAGCDADLQRNTPACPLCALPLPAASNGPCGECQRRRLPFTAVHAPLAYEFPTDAAIKAFKFHRRLFYVPAFADILCAAAAALPSGIDAVLPVPLHRWRKLRRGFNQARELALPVARHLALPVLECVRRRRHTPYQSGLPAADRRRNLEGAFEVSGRIEARHVLLVDDVVTTGTTCRQIALLLKQHGVREVSVLALARANAAEVRR